MQTRRYDMDRALEPIWRGESVYLESVMLVGGRNRVDLASCSPSLGRLALAAALAPP